MVDIGNSVRVNVGASEPVQAATAVNVGASEPVGPRGRGRPEGVLAAVSSGLQRGTKQTFALARAGGGVLQVGAGQALGLDALEKRGEAQLQEALALSQRAQAENPRAVEKFEDISGLGSAGLFAADVVSEAIPNLVGIAASGGAGGLIGKGLATQAAKRGAKRVLKDKASDAAIAVGQKRVAQAGATTGVFAGATGLETGATGIELLGATGEARPVESVVAGTIKGTLESLTPLALGKATGLLDEASSGILSKLSSELAQTLTGPRASRILAGASAAAGAEGATEAAQEIVDIAARKFVDDNFDVMSPETGSRILNAFVAGSIVGGTFGGVASGVSGKTAPEEELTFDAMAPLRATLPGTPPVDKAVLESSLRVVTPGSKPEHAEVGYELLPAPHRNVPARDVADLRKASIELQRAKNELRVENGKERLEDLRDERKNVQGDKAETAILRVEAKMIREVIQDLNAQNELLKAASLTTRKRSFPIIRLRQRGAPKIAVDRLGLEQSFDLPDGYTAEVVGRTAQNVRVSNAKGRVILQGPNQKWLTSTYEQAAFSDRDLEQSGFYSTAANNLVRRAQQGGSEFVDDALKVQEEWGDYTAPGTPRPEEIKLEALKVSSQKSELPVPDAEAAAAVRFTKVNKWWNTLLQLAEMNKFYQPLQVFKDVVINAKATMMKFVAANDEIAKDALRLGSPQLKALNDFFWDLERQTYRTKEEVDLGINRPPTQREEFELAKEKGLFLATYETGKAMQAQQQEMFNEQVRWLRKRVLKIKDRDAAAEQLTKLDTLQEQYFSRPRFPFTDFGKFVVEVRDKSGRLVEARRFESQTDQTIEFGRFKRDFPEAKGFVVRETKLVDEAERWSGAPSLVLRDLRQAGLLPTVKRDQFELMLYLSEANPTRRRFLRTRDAARGRDFDIVRSFANWSIRNSQQLFNMHAAEPMEQAVGLMEADVRSGQSTNQLADMVEYFKGYQQELLAPKDDMAWARSFAFNYWIAWVPASAVINATQVPMVAWPYLTAQFGTLAASRKLGAAYGKINNWYDKAGLKRMSEAESKAKATAIGEGVIEANHSADLAGLANGGNVQRALPGNKLVKTSLNFAYYGGFMFQAVEKMARHVTFDAAFNLGLENSNNAFLKDLERMNPRRFKELVNEGFTEVEARAYLGAVESVRSTMFDYSAWNKPKFLRNKVGGSIGAFWLFTQNMLWFAKNAPGALRFWLVMLAVGGLTGVPGGDDMAELTRALAQRFFGKDFDVELEARKWLKDVVNPLMQEKAGFEVNADILLHGLSYNGFGLASAGDALGIPFVPEVDFSTSLSMGRISPVSPSVLGTSKDFQQSLTDTTEGVAGASFGPFFALAQTLGDKRLPAEDFKRWEKAMPRAVRGLLKAGRRQAEGGERSSNFGEILNYDPTDPKHSAELWMQAAGFNPSRVSKEWAKRIPAYERARFFSEQRKELLNQLAYTVTMKHKIAEKDVMKKVGEFNRSLPADAKAMAISRKTIRRSLKQRLRGQELTGAGLPVRKSERGIFQEVDRVFNGEVVEERKVR